eukprot:CAMPEP_0196794342 /NCGR_PEP_ID=MMETSP1104-20130614/34304_1 /TAXON_ID=33652 /ORGANISM="Cafeteria sp., Strain Caron Lab Isolate" /LENGTH=49 /DNA_ID= /DNA_START= /DNA_END= /DNA_ORIENTATION=
MHLDVAYDEGHGWRPTTYMPPPSDSADWMVRRRVPPAGMGAMGPAAYGR